MAKELTLGIQFNLDQGWMGGAYYLQNVLSALATLEDDEQPSVVVIANEAHSYDFLKESGYRKLSHFTGQQVIADANHHNIDLLFPHPLGEVDIPTLTWIPDFQEHHMSFLFSESEIEGRRRWHNDCFKYEGLLLSSESALSDFHNFYKGANIPSFVVPFSSFLPKESVENSKLREKYGLPEKYFFAPNQFWMHKNHLVILAALRCLRERNIHPLVCFSGKEFDHRAPGYVDFLKSKIEEWEIGSQVHFLGFMPRDEQVSVMHHALAIIQPSRFEGWSTVVEDAKAVNQFIIASNLDVHREQLSNNFELFEPSSFVQLADILAHHWREYQPRILEDYRYKQREFGQRLMGVFRILVNANYPRRIPLPQVRQSDISSTIDDSDIFGLSASSEDPIDGNDRKGKYRWMHGNEILISGNSISEHTSVLFMRFRNFAKGQTVSVHVDDATICDAAPINVADPSVSLELMFDLSRHIGRSKNIRICISKMYNRDAKSVGLLVEKMDFITFSKKKEM